MPLLVMSWLPLSHMVLCVPQLCQYRWSPLRNSQTSSGLCDRGWENCAANDGGSDLPISCNLLFLNSLSVSLAFCFSPAQITVTETVLFLVQYTSKEFDRSEKTVATGDCCYLNPLVRRTFRFLGKSQTCVVLISANSKNQILFPMLMSEFFHQSVLS